MCMQPSVQKIKGRLKRKGEQEVPREHLTYWFTTDDSNGDSVCQDCYYLRDARRQAQKLANEWQKEVYINQGNDIVDVAFPNKK